VIVFLWKRFAKDSHHIIDVDGRGFGGIGPRNEVSIAMSLDREIGRRFASTLECFLRLAQIGIRISTTVDVSKLYLV
jgi:hypothetical protein